MESAHLAARTTTQNGSGTGARAAVQGIATPGDTVCEAEPNGAAASAAAHEPVAHGDGEEGREPERGAAGDSAQGLADQRIGCDVSAVWVFDGGPNRPLRLPRGRPTLVVGVDAGLVHARRLGVSVDVAVGDFDSVPAHELAAARAERPDMVVLRHRPDKDRSDLDLALSHVRGLDPGTVTVVSGGGGRLDHLLIGVLLLGQPAYASMQITARIAEATLRAAAAGDAVRLAAADGALVSLLAIGGSARAQTTGLRWDLTPDTVLGPGATLGLSNELSCGPVADSSHDPETAAAVVEVSAGTVLVCQTHGTLLDAR